MVEFDCVESAKRAKQELHGCDIYSGCCTLRIEFAKVLLQKKAFDQLVLIIIIFSFLISLANSIKCLQK